MRQPLIALAALLVLSSTASADLIYDNGDPDGSSGYSNILTDANGGIDRRVADDFVLVGGRGWVVTNVEMNYIWGTPGAPGTATQFLVQFFADNAGGGPGTLINEQVSTDFTATETGNIFFSRAEFIFSVDLAPVALDADTNYWVSIQPAGDDNGFQLTSHEPHIIGQETYVQFSENGPDWVSGSIQFGFTFDMVFRLYGEAVSEPCPWDFDGTGSVGLSDLLSLLASWGPCANHQGCPEDLDDNGTVGVSDLLAILANWGACP